MIIHKSFKHGWFYHYRVHLPKAEKLCGNGFSSLNKYLLDVHRSCPDDYFSKGPRGSGLRMDLGIHPKKIVGHEVSELARLGLESKKFKTAHSNVQMFMLQNDATTIGVEVPIWICQQEMPNYYQIFNSSDPLTGHIDALRIEGNKIWVWDYKPNAHKEKYATIQTNFYALMLSKRTNIPLSEFRCGYFDDEEAYVFKPEIATLKSKFGQ
jgi:hypothetical protein